LQGRQPVEAAAHPLALKTRFDLLGDLVEGGVVGAPSLALLAFAGRAYAAHPVDGAAVGEGEDPGQGAAPARIEAGGGTPQFEQHLLGHLLRLRRVPHDATYKPEHRAGHQSVQLLEGLLVTTGHEHQKLVRLHSFPLSPATWAAPSRHTRHSQRTHLRMGLRISGPKKRVRAR
jgi:hypothetical protein